MVLSRVRICSERGKKEEQREFNMSKAFYQYGQDKLLKTTLVNPDDALNSLIAVLSSFLGLSMDSKNGKTGMKQRIVFQAKKKR